MPPTHEIAHLKTIASFHTRGTAPVAQALVAQAPVAEPPQAEAS
jgi:hypothetical protein